MMSVTQFEGIKFEFYAMKKRTFVLTGSVALEADAMRLMVELPGEDPYRINGRRRSDGVFEGRHEGNEEDYDVNAKWTEIDGVYFGFWDEADEHFIFSFSVVRS